MLGVYVHFPFCHRLCPFCDFYVQTKFDQSLIDQYTQALIQEIHLYQEYGWKKENEITSIYFGGGTPSLISPFHLDTVLRRLQKYFPFFFFFEITLESNPEDVHVDRAQSWKRLGINRISLGVQSIDDKQLKKLGRSHKSKDVYESMRILRKAGFENISMDLLFALEDQSLQDWKTTLDRAISCSPEHISCYQLTIEENTHFDKLVEEGRMKLPIDDVVADMILRGREQLILSGYRPYEISNAARKGFESTHNLGYWKGHPYWGIGVSAHSFQLNNGRIRRFQNPKNLVSYVQSMTHSKPDYICEDLSPKTLWEDLLLTGLRLEEGIDIKYYEKKFGPAPKSFLDNIETLCQSHLVYKQGNLTLRTQHIPILNEVLHRIFTPSCEAA